MEVKKKVAPYLVELYCDQCGEPFVAGKMLLTDPPQWEHECLSCGDVKNLYEKYPAIRYELLEG